MHTSISCVTPDMMRIASISKDCPDNRFFITLDLDYSDIRRYTPGTHPGILLIRARNRSVGPVTDILVRVAAERSLDDLRGCLVIANPSFTRIRRPPLPR